MGWISRPGSIVSVVYYPSANVSWHGSYLDSTSGVALRQSCLKFPCHRSCIILNSRFIFHERRRCYVGKIAHDEIEIDSSTWHSSFLRPPLHCHLERAQYQVFSILLLFHSPDRHARSPPVRKSYCNAPTISRCDINWPKESLLIFSFELSRRRRRWFLMSSESRWTSRSRSCRISLRFCFKSSLLSTDCLSAELRFSSLAETYCDPASSRECWTAKSFGDRGPSDSVSINLDDPQPMPLVAEVFSDLEVQDSFLCTHM